MKKLNLLTACVFALFVLNSSAVEPAKPDDKSWFEKHITGGANDGVKESVKDTIKETYKATILTPVINWVKGIVLPSGRAEKTQKDTAEIVTLSEQIKKLRDAGGCRKYVAHLQAQLKSKIEDSTKSGDPKK